MVDNLLNEEELKGKVLLPYLQELGLGPQDISLEYYFQIQLPKDTAEVGTNREDSIRKGFADIVCRSPQGKNLFVIELKAPGKELTDQDRIQALTYARLLIDNMPPIVILTNGRKTILFDVVSGDEIDPDDKNISEILDGRRIATADEIAIRTEALERFIGMNEKNLACFCKWQHQSYLSNLEGSINEGFKYSPDLFIPREQIHKNVRAFLGSDLPFMPILGEAGRGKTNIICDLAKRLNQEGHLTLFYNAAQMGKSLESAIREDFDWFFSSSQNLPQRLRQLRRFLKDERRVIILIDAIDEWKMSDPSCQLNDFVNSVYPLNGAVKVIASCKPADWEHFKAIGGSRSHLDRLAFKDHVGENDVYIVINSFNKAERDDAYNKYKQCYAFQGKISIKLESQLEHPNNLRLLSLVYSGKQLPQDLDEKDVLKIYLDQETYRYKGLVTLLKSLAELLFDQINILHSEKSLFSGAKEYVEEEKLKRKLQIPPLSCLPDMPFSRNLLLRFYDDKGECYVGFYHEAIKNYILALWTLSLEQMSKEELEENIPQYNDCRFTREALTWYARFADQSFIEVFRDHLNKRAEEFLNATKFLVEKVSPGLFTYFFPDGEGDIGLAYSGVIKHDGITFGFRRLAKEHNSTIVEMSDAPYPIGNDKHFAIWNELGVRQIRASSRNFVTYDPKESALEFYYDKLNKLVEEGQIDWFVNETFCMEAIYSIMSKSYDSFKRVLPPKNPEDIDPLEKLEPISLELVDKAIDLHFAKEHFMEQYHQDKLKRGDYESNGKTITMRGTREEWMPYIQKAYEHVEAGKERLYCKTSDNFPVNTLIKCVESLCARGIYEIKHPLPRPKEGKLATKNIRRSTDYHFARYGDNELKHYMKKLYFLYIKCYIDIINQNFPGLKDILIPPADFKYDVFIHFDRYDEPKFPGHAWNLIIRHAPAEDPNAAQIVVTISPEEPLFDPYHNPEFARTQFRTLDDIFTVIGDNPPFEPSTNDSYTEYAVIRKMIYDTLEKSFKRYRDLIQAKIRKELDSIGEATY